MTLDRQQYRAVEGRLYHYEDMKAELAAFREENCGLRAGGLRAMPRGQALRSDPTAWGALALAVPPPSLETAQRWIDAIDRALARLRIQAPLLAELFSAYYQAHPSLPPGQRVDAACRALDLDRWTFHQKRHLLVEAVYLEAVYDHLLIP